MPVMVKKGRKGYTIVEKGSGKVKGHSKTKRDAEASARARNAARKGWKPSGTGRRGR
jgi:hypothetical protein